MYIITMKPSVYFDSTFFSFYFDDRVESQHRRDITIDWWNSQRHFFSPYTSPFVIDEISNPVYPNWEKVSALAQTIPLLTPSDEIEGIINLYLEHKLMPQDDAGDAAHLAMASFYEIDYLLTWNCIHLANANKTNHIRTLNLRMGLLTPEIITPEQLFREV
jgi:predicted nucleic acid-binding protein